MHCEIALRWMPENFMKEKSALVQVMAWCHQATSHYMSQCWPRSMSSNGVTRPQWVKSLQPIWRSGVRPTNDISIKFEIQPKFVVLWFKMYSTDHNEILHTSRQCNCRDVSEISLWLVEYILNQSTANFGRISNLILISLVGRAPGICRWNLQVPNLELPWDCSWCDWPFWMMSDSEILYSKSLKSHWKYP